MTIKDKFSSIDQSKLTADQKAFLDKIKNVTKNFTDSEMNKKVEQPLDNFIAKAKEKMPEAIKSAPAKKTSKAKSSQTRKPKRTIMSVAKDIRKEGESWKDAQARAKRMMKEDSQELSKAVETELDKLSKLVKSQKHREKLSGISGTDIKRDSVRKAKPRGARKVTRSGETSNQYGTFKNHLGRKYYENRDRHSDRLAPRYPKYAPLLARGGGVGDNVLGLKKGDIYKVIDEHHLSTGKVYTFIDYVDYQNQIRLKSLPFPSKPTKKDDFVYVSEVSSDGIKILNNEEIGKVISRDYKNYIENNFENGGYLTDPTFGTFQNQVFDEGGKIGVETILFGVKKGEPDWNEVLITNNPDRIEDAKKWALANGFDRLRVSKIDINEKPDFRKTFAEGGDIDAFTLRMVKSNGIQPAEVLKEDANVKYNKGGALTNERRHVNHEEDYEVRYAKPRPHRKGYKGVRGFELGGTIVTDLAGHTGGSLGGDPTMLDGMSGTSYTGLVGETGAMSSGEMFMAGGTLPSGAEQPYMITESLGNPAQHFAKGGGVRRVGNREYSYGRNWTNDHNHVNKGEEHEVKYTRKGKFLGIFNDGGGVGEKYVVEGDKVLNTHTNMYVDYDFRTRENAEDFAKHRNYMFKKFGKDFADGGYLTDPNFGNFQNQVLATGGALTNERRHVNHEEDYEVRYAKPRPHRKGYKGVRSFAGGGGIGETPKIYVADLEAYNNGRLQGEWLDLADYNDADELMDAIQGLLDQWGVEEYAIHDAEYIPSSMYSEYMGRRDFEELYQMMDLAKDNDLPLEVVQDIVSQYGESAVDDFYGRYDSAVDFAEQLVDEVGIESFKDFEYYLEVSETDRRLLSQEMADSYVDDIRDEDGGNRLIEEAGLDVEEYEEADSDRQEEMLDEAREIVYNEYYDTWYEGLSDPYYFLVKEQGLYDAESFANANFVMVDYEKLADALEQDYTFIEHDGEVYVFNIR